MILSTVLIAMAIPFTLGIEWLNAVKVGEQRRQGAQPKDEETKGDSSQGMPQSEKESDEKGVKRSEETPLPT